MEDQDQRPLKRRRISQTSELEITVADQMQDAELDKPVRSNSVELDIGPSKRYDDSYQPNVMPEARGENEKPAEKEVDHQDGLGLDPSGEPTYYTGVEKEHDLVGYDGSENYLEDFAGIETDIAEKTTMSKSKMKKLKREQEWEASRAARKEKRKQKIQEKKERKRAVRDAVLDTESTDSHAIRGDCTACGPKSRAHVHPIQLPIAFVFDCSFDDLMLDKERISLGAQLTRCYSDNTKAPFRAYMAISSFTGLLRERFDTVLSGQYHQWKGVRFFEEAFLEVAGKAKGWMAGDRGGRLEGAFKPSANPQPTSSESLTLAEDAGEVVYLTSDSPNTLTSLRPYTTYIIGGLVDRNRHKGICYKRALDNGVKTARLPIGEYMEMTSRFVLATNHVSEIMLKWLECGDWGEAFLKVMPKRKGGALKNLEAKLSSNGSTSNRGAEKNHDEDVIRNAEADAGSQEPKG